MAPVKKGISLSQAWDMIGGYGRMVVSLSVIVASLGILISAITVMANVTDDHIRRVAAEQNKPIVSMLTYIMQHEGLWDSYRATQDTVRCNEQLTLGKDCQ